MLDEWLENPPLEIIGKIQTGYKGPSETIQPGIDKWFGEDELTPEQKRGAARPMEQAPKDVQDLFADYVRRKGMPAKSA